MKFRKWKLWFLVILLLTTSIPVYATNLEELEDSASDLKDELSDLNSELDSITKQIKETSDTLEKTKAELAVAKGKEEAQYEAMTLRIKYLYENGNHSILEMLLSAGSLAEFLNHTEYYSSIMEYDRELLDELVALREEVAVKEQTLIDSQKHLQELQTSLDKKIANTSADISKYEKKIEAAKAEIKRLEEEAKEEVVPAVPEKEPEKPNREEPKEEPKDEPSDNPEAKPSEKPSDDSKDDSSDKKESLVDTCTDLELFAALLECEAGYRDYEAVLAVASVVVNRMNSRYYPDTLRGVILQSGQFPPATNGLVEKKLERGVKDLCVTAAQDALAGKNNVGDCLQFRAASSGHDGIIIGDNVFF